MPEAVYTVFRAGDQDLPSSGEVMDMMLKIPVVSVSKTRMRLAPEICATPVMPSREVMPAPEMVEGADQVLPPSVEMRWMVS